MDQDHGALTFGGLKRSWWVQYGDNLQHDEPGRPAKVTKDEVVPDVDSNKVGGVEGRTMSAMPSHLG